MNHPPSVTAQVLTANGMLIPNSIGNTGGFFTGLPRMARAAMMGRGSTEVQFVTCVVNRENLNALAALLESGDIKVVIDKIYALSETANAVAHMLGHHARGKVVLTVPGADGISTTSSKSDEETGPRQLSAMKETL